MTKKPRVLVDCDGVLADFASACLDLIESRTGDRHTHEELVHWDIFKSVDKDHLNHILKDAVEHDGFCLKLRPLSNAKHLMSLLNSNYDIFIVTSPFLARNWVYERTRWLENHFGILGNKIAHVKSKEIVCGDVLIDDSAKNLRAWKKAWPKGVAILYDAPYNRDDVEFPRASHPNEVLAILENALQGKCDET